MKSPLSVLMLIGCTLVLQACAGLFRSLPAPLYIVSPRNGSTHRAGTNLKVRVESEKPRSYDGVAVVLEGAHFSAARESAPFEFTLPIPEDENGPRELRAFGVTFPRDVALSPPVRIIVEPSGPLVSLSAGLVKVQFLYPGERFFLDIEGRLASGVVIDVCGDGQTALRTTDERVATVTADCLLTATGPGKTILIVDRGHHHVVVPIFVRDNMPGDFDGDRDVDDDDIQALLEHIAGEAAAASCSTDARDLNRDGLITEADVERLRRLCSRPRCRRY